MGRFFSDRDGTGSGEVGLMALLFGRQHRLPESPAAVEAS
jgi:hypothetical protein